MSGKWGCRSFSGSSFLSSFQTPILVRRDVMMLFKYLAEITARPKPGLQRNLQDAPVRIPQKLLCLLQPDGEQKVSWRDAQYIPEGTDRKSVV